MDEIKRLRLVATDRVKFSRTAHWLYSHLLEHTGGPADAGDPNAVARSLQRLTQAARLGCRLRNLDRLEAKIRETAAHWRPADLDWDRFFPDSGSRLVRRSILLKRPRPNGEKGVLFIAFEDEWLRLFRYARLAQLAQDYDLVLSPTWSPPHDLPFLTAATLWPSTLFMILSNHDDLPVFPRLASKVKAVPLLASSWVRPELFAPFGDPVKSYDVAMLANFAQYKRHFALFRALRNMEKTTALLLGRGWAGRTRQTIEEEARLFGVLDRITIQEGLEDAEMIAALQSAKVSVILSMREGSCVAVAESLFANVPVGLLEGANIGSRIFINEQTGCFLRPGALAEDLAGFLRRYRVYEPRQWALENGISCTASTAILNDALKSSAKAAGRPWTVDIVPLHWRPNAEFLNPGDKESMRDEYARFEKAYGVTIALSE